MLRPRSPLSAEIGNASSSLGAGLSCTQASGIGAPSAENVDFVVIQIAWRFPGPAAIKGLVSTTKKRYAAARAFSMIAPWRCRWRW